MEVTGALFLIFLAVAGARNIPTNTNEPSGELQQLIRAILPGNTTAVQDGEFYRGLIESAANVEDLQLLEETYPMVINNVLNTAHDAEIPAEVQLENIVNAANHNLHTNRIINGASKEDKLLSNLLNVSAHIGANVNSNETEYSDVEDVLKPVHVNGEDDTVTYTRYDTGEIDDRRGILDASTCLGKGRFPNDECAVPFPEKNSKNKKRFRKIKIDRTSKSNYITSR